MSFLYKARGRRARGFVFGTMTCGQELRSPVSVCCHCHLLSMCRPLRCMLAVEKPSLPKTQSCGACITGWMDLLCHCVSIRTHPTAIISASFKRSSYCICISFPPQCVLPWRSAARRWSYNNLSAMKAVCRKSSRYSLC